MASGELDVVGIGNALVDVLSQAEESLVERQGLVKGTMHLVDEQRARTLYEAMGPGVEMSGGSAANTVVGVASFGGRAHYVGKVRDDLHAGDFRQGVHQLLAAASSADAADVDRLVGGEPPGRGSVARGQQGAGSGTQGMEKITAVVRLHGGCSRGKSE